MDQFSVFKKCFFFSSIFFLSYFLFYHQIYDAEGMKYSSDLPKHINLAIQFLTGESSHTHPGFPPLIGIFHILKLSYSDSAILVLAITVTVISILIYRILVNLLKDMYSEEQVLFFSLALIIVTAIYVPFFNKDIYLGQGSPNVWHSPTLLVVKPFSILSIFFTVQFLSSKRHQDSYKFMFILAILFFISSLMKPNFIIAFLPGLFIFLVMKQIKNKELNLRLNLKLCLISLPTVFILLWQYLIKFDSVEGKSKIIIFLFAVWGRLTPNPIISLLLLIAFPLAILIFRFKKVIKDDYIILSWICFGVALAQYIVFAESAPMFSHGNFGWGRIIMVHILFVFSTVEFLKWIKSISINTVTWELVQIYVTSTLLSLHIVSGLFYFIKILSGGRYG